MLKLCLECSLIRTGANSCAGVPKVSDTSLSQLTACEWMHCAVMNDTACSANVIGCDVSRGCPKCGHVVQTVKVKLAIVYMTAIHLHQSHDLHALRSPQHTHTHTHTHHTTHTTPHTHTHTHHTHTTPHTPYTTYTHTTHTTHTHHTAHIMHYTHTTLHTPCTTHTPHYTHTTRLLY